jgi:hypothetical protein
VTGALGSHLLVATAVGTARGLAWRWHHCAGRVLLPRGQPVETGKVARTYPLSAGTLAIEDGVRLASPPRRR